jgi:hypothetical protein
MVYLWLRAGATGLYDIRVRCCRLEAGAEASGSVFMDADEASGGDHRGGVAAVTG